VGIISPSIGRDDTEISEKGGGGGALYWEKKANTVRQPTLF